MDNMDCDSTSTNPIVYLELAFNGAKAGRVIIELFKDRVPKAAENFRALCTGERGIGRCGKPLHYKGCMFHRVVPLCMVQAGDIINQDGTSGESIYGATFEDENFNTKHTTEGMVGMMNKGRNTNQSQFYITTVPCTHLDDTNVIVGRVLKGLNIIVEMADLPREIDDRPAEPITINDCGEIKPGDSFNIQERDGTEDTYPPWPNDWDMDTKNHSVVLKAIKAIKDSGNHFYKRNNFVDAERKYTKTLRYIDWYLCHENKPNKSVDNLRILSMLNLSAAKIKRNKFKEALLLCNQILEKEERNGKAFYRRAQARLGLKDYDKALTDLNSAICLHPNDTHVRNMLNVTKQYKLNYLKKERKAFAKLFQ